MSVASDRRLAMRRFPLRIAILTSSLALVALSGCASYVKRDEFDVALADLRSADQRLQIAD